MNKDDTITTWNGLSLPDLMNKLREAPSHIMFVKNAPEEAQLYAVMRRPSLVNVIQNPTNHVIRTALMNSKWFLSSEEYGRFIETVKSLFETKEGLRDKWLRYGEQMRNQ